jgi:hypothetical protein
MQPDTVQNQHPCIPKDYSLFSPIWLPLYKARYRTNATWACNASKLSLRGASAGEPYGPSQASPQGTRISPSAMLSN